MLSLSTLHASLSTSLALQYELAQKNAAATAGGLDVQLPEFVSFIGLLCIFSILYCFGNFTVRRLLGSNLIQILQKQRSQNLIALVSWKMFLVRLAVFYHHPRKR